ncbi:GNAT family N-acetyltransferase [Asanoa sp. WMMD1127]|uniref:GNAT family N-acetyltransferase n=1 Tax=Asanoa sp. WMMD1127 TaxID=3016107 RepID=UPI002417ED6E|nr:GNAT family N-acetyltransferase [Asanoa sp. WMMD1127]MDG4827338.1 GNAT family N-acetyltransferase [Asanoa sp. WMMD1127]
MSSPALTVNAESVEAELMRRLAVLAPASAAEALGMTSGRVGGGVVISLRHDPAGGFFNRALGLGLTEPVTTDVIAEVLDFHRRHGSPACHVQIAPDLLPPDWAGIAATHQLHVGSALVKVAAEVDDVKPAGTDLRIGPVGADQVDAWAALTWELFEIPNPHLAAAVAAVARTDSSQAFAAWDGDVMVGVANLFMHGETAQLNSGATRATHRRRGVQSALIAERTAWAADAGCRWVVTEAEKPAVEGGNQSLNNMIRAGFTPLYERPNWIWRP